MIASVRDAIIRLTQTTDYPPYVAELTSIRQSALESLAAMDPDDHINLARTQGRIYALDEVLRLRETATFELEQSKGTNNG